ncbi:RNA polymerase sigma factor [Alloiococcus sp. CFN-8]|uniref:RNA polymerase sigma factor n=1 Tax=Alloiococcus sp. CFN-8 TaxID=3416081 RepID=UPI003CF4DB2C
MTEFEDIYQRYFKVVFLYIKSISRSDEIAEEVTAEAFFKALKALDSFKGQCDIRIWLCEIAKNCYYTYLKKHKREELIDELPENELYESKSVEKKLIDKNDAYRIHQLLHKMPEPYKEVFTLRIFGELSFQAIGKLFDKSENWACVTFHRAKKKILLEMEDYHE